MSGVCADRGYCCTTHQLPITSSNTHTHTHTRNTHTHHPHPHHCIAIAPRLTPSTLCPMSARVPARIGNGQWNTGTTAILAHATGIAPSKDNYWSTPIQAGTHYGPLTREWRNRMQSAVSSLTTGPVAPSDMVCACVRACVYVCVCVRVWVYVCVVSWELVCCSRQRRDI